MSVPTYSRVLQGHLAYQFVILFKPQKGSLQRTFEHHCHSVRVRPAWFHYLRQLALGFVKESTELSGAEFKSTHGQEISKALGIVL